MENNIENTPPDEWRQRIEKELKDTAYESTLWPIAEGVTGKPDYSKKDLPETTTFIPNNWSEEGWFAKEEIPIFTFDSANKQALKVLMQGANALEFTGNINRDTDLKTLLKDIELPHLALFFGPQNQPVAFLEQLIQVAKSRQFALEKVTGGMSFDPIGTLAQRGNWNNNEMRDRETATSLIQFCIENHLQNFNSVLINASTYHNGGADVVWEMALALAHGNEYLQWMQDEGIAVTKGAQHLHFKFSAGRHYFAHIAKFRAFRPLWANVCAAHGVSVEIAAEVFVSAETSRRERSPMDPHTNLIRSTTQSMAAILGGCNALLVLPFDQSNPKKLDFASRLARNIQLILSEESYFGAVSDPASGSYLFDKISTQVMTQAWATFKEIESRGGLIESLKDGWVQEKIDQQATAEDQRIASGESVFVGINKYRNAAEIQTEAPELENVMESKQVVPIFLRTAMQAIATINTKQ